ncbi:MAG TPA: hypothetical protein VK558_13870, partial [Patescibacteria group bacterium]|nr:hypothetical protein [Patescibacteria group bacterium]
MASHCVRILALLACLTACSGAAPLGHDVYIWQRQWTPAVTAAIAQFSDLVGTWRVLGASTDTGGHLQASAPDWAV